uniref:Uncharacterized protein n=1 Tax=Opuntia streptacantha TaxID=393608 RepID=A0A7C8ZTZ9_OPUST
MLSTMLGNLCFNVSRFLKSAHIVVVTKDSPEDLGGLHLWIPRSEGDRKRDVGLDLIGPKHAEIPAHQGPHIMGHQVHSGQPKMVKECHKVPNQMEASVGCNRRGGVGVTVAP